jgi:hypothetical protein
VRFQQTAGISLIANHNCDLGGANRAVSYGIGQRDHIRSTA